MRHSEGIQVFIKNIDIGKHYDEYRKPGGKEVPSHMERFIEVLDEQKFSIVVQLDSSFKFYRAKGLLIAVLIDTEWWTTGNLYRQKSCRILSMSSK
jgi:hypothetical protein